MHQGVAVYECISDSEEDASRKPTFASVAMTKHTIQRILPQNEKKRGEEDGNDTAKNDGLSSSIAERLNKKRRELLSRGHISSRASSKPRTPGF